MWQWLRRWKQRDRESPTDLRAEMNNVAQALQWHAMDAHAAPQVGPQHKCVRLGTIGILPFGLVQNVDLLDDRALLIG